MQKTSVSVIVPSYKRTEDLKVCLRSLERQLVAPDEVIIVYREEDLETRTFLDSARLSHTTLRRIEVHSPGLAHAINKGVESSGGEIIAFTDDDAEPDEDWVKEIISFFEKNPEAGGVGGRDRFASGLPEKDSPPKASTFGCLDRWGRFHGNHHCPIGADLVEVDYPKGVNMAWRSSLIQDIDVSEGMWGEGAVPCTEMVLGYVVKAKGFQVYLSDKISVKHNVSERSEGDEREDNLPFSKQVLHNKFYVVSHYGPKERLWPAFLRCALIGGSRHPGLLALPFFGRQNYSIEELWQILSCACVGWEAGLKKRNCFAQADAVSVVGYILSRLLK
ncbi:MAG: glycosyltransferase [Verrucomicrobiota bacterium JB023]|nr:glycosyltransferase [Verrucomicrobiota bacterium JB023]